MQVDRLKNRVKDASIFYSQNAGLYASLDQQ